MLVNRMLERRVCCWRRYYDSLLIILRRKRNMAWHGMVVCEIQICLHFLQLAGHMNVDLNMYLNKYL